MRKIIKILTSKIFILAVLILLQLAILIAGIVLLANYFAYFYSVMVVLSIIIVIYLINSNGNYSYKIAWMMPILLFPLGGGLFYIMFGNKKLPKKTIQKTLMVTKEMSSLHDSDKGNINELKSQNMDAYKQAKYLNDSAGFALYKNTECEYLFSGEIYYQKILQELKKAQKFIFLEYFIIEEGEFWNSILEILAEKARLGVEIFVMYDDAGCINTLPTNYHKKLEKMGIRVVVFNRLEPFLITHMNNRDHRKILVVDGNVAFTGGINLADEYINAKMRFGHWKDSGIMLRGEVAWDISLMFMQFWNVCSKQFVFQDYTRYKPYFEKPIKAEGYVLPYCDSPMDEEVVGENAHINMFNMANEYVYIKTPYLICDNEVIKSLTLAAKNGVDVRIILPRIPDKWYVHTVTKAYYQPLMEAGVKIYEYVPGFIHSKEVICDHQIAMIGTTNMDYRSYYLHYECGVWMYKTACIKNMYQDFMQTLEKCERIDMTYFKKENLFIKIARAILRLFAPLM